MDPLLTQADFAGLTLDEMQALYNGSAGGASFDISWALDSRGHRVHLPEIRFIRVDVISGKAEIDGFTAVSEKKHGPKPHHPRGPHVGIRQK
jgi:hypothetical protein